MFFWFMLFMNIWMPLTMIGFGYYYSKNVQKDINSISGYRTFMSMKNKDTWQLANKYASGFLFKIGLAILPISIIFMLFLIGRD